MKQQNFFLFLIFFLIKSLNAQPTLIWDNFYDPDEVIDRAVDVGFDNSGNAYVTGFSGNFIATVKYSTNGTELWDERFDAEGSYLDLFGYALAVFTDGQGNAFIYVTGHVNTTNRGRDFVVLKYNSGGTLLWSTDPYNGPDDGEDVSRHIEVDANGNAYVTGYSQGDGSGFDYVTIKYASSNGAKMWERRFDYNNADDKANCLKLDDNGNAYVNGYCRYGGNSYLTTIALDNDDGGVIWYERDESSPIPAGPPAVDGGNTITVRSGYGVFVTGIAYYDEGEEEWLCPVIKHDISDGEILWTEIHPGQRNNSIGFFPRPCIGNDPCTITDIYVTGRDVFGRGQTIKIRDDGNDGVVEWPSICSTGVSIEFQQLAIDAFGNVFVTGSRAAQSGNIGIDYFIVVKYEPEDGIEQWSESYESSGAGQDIKVDNNGDIYVTGDCCVGVADYLTLKYSEGNGRPYLENSQNNLLGIPKNFALNQNYPNPFNPSTQIKYELPQSTSVTIKIYNAAGKLVSILANSEFKSAGYHSTEFDGTALASGIYFYTIEAGQFRDSKKMVLIK